MILFAAAIVFLFTLFNLSKDDFVLLRRNVSQRMIFDIAFVGGLTGLFLSRVAYVSLHPSSAYLNPLVFFVIPYFPGLSSSGFILGLCITVYVFAAQKKLPKGKVFDIFTMSLLASAETYFFLQGVVEVVARHFFLAGIHAASFFVLFLVYFLLKKLMQSNKTKDGYSALVGLTSLTFVIALAQVSTLSFKVIPKELPYFGGILLIIVISFFIRILVKQEGHE